MPYDPEVLKSHIAAGTLSRASVPTRSDEAADRVLGALQSIDADALAEILRTPGLLETLANSEMAARGRNREGAWVGFDRARAIWTEGR